MIANISIANPSMPTTSSNNLLAYRPKVKDDHKSYLLKGKKTSSKYLVLVNIIYYYMRFAL